MAEHHLPPEPADEPHHHNHGGKAAVHADDLKPGGRRRRYGYYYGDGYGSADPARTLCFVVLVVILLAGITALVLYLVYRPSRPAFAVTSVAVYSLSLNGTGTGTGAVAGGPATLAASFQLSARHPQPERAVGGAVRPGWRRTVAVPAGSPSLAPAPMPAAGAVTADSAVAVAPVLGAGAAGASRPGVPRHRGGARHGRVVRRGGAQGGGARPRPVRVRPVPERVGTPCTPAATSSSASARAAAAARVALCEIHVEVEHDIEFQRLTSAAMAGNTLKLT
ncbi:hypothetical protein OsI_19681 [Oryza sativa Indica Group]|uniref:Late embryogenesis abundant protein LEA-2 subgroup domain-containing protein n=1 Tax=Oryza sativa subsp. indica TaxID=39946 RepID=B8AXF6_ORYSI|nr:hypothetical protein OsI_19681 [Oryza sativa Indica Group]